MGKEMRFWFFSCNRPAKAQKNLSACDYSGQPLASLDIIATHACFNNLLMYVRAVPFCHVSQHTTILYLFQRRPSNSQTNLCIRTFSTETHRVGMDIYVQAYIEFFIQKISLTLHQIV